MAKTTSNKQTKRNNKTTTIRLFNGRSINLPVDIKFGKFTADKVCLEETAINNKVLRVSIKSLVNGVIQNNPKRSTKKSLQKPANTRTIQRKIAKNNSQQPRDLRVDAKIILRKRTRNNQGHRDNKTKDAQLRINTNINLLHKLKKKRRSQTMSSIEAMIPEFKITKSIKKSATTRTTTTTNYKYLLKSTPNLCDYEPSRLCLDFVELPKMLRTIKLPDPTWKIKIFMKDIMTMSISITNNKLPERCVIFTAKNKLYQIIIDGTPVRLLGCPKTLSDPKDFEALFHIVSSLSVDDCMVSPLTKTDNF